MYSPTALLLKGKSETHTMKYESYKRDIAVRVLRKLASIEDASPDYVTRVDEVMKALDEFLPTDDSANRGHTELVDIVPVYEVDKCPDCGKSEPMHTDIHPFCPDCGYSFN